MIKYCLYVLTFLITATVTAQQPAFHLNRLPEQDTLVSGWKMYAGDDAHFSDPDLDDSKWLPIDLTKGIQHYPQFHHAGVMWLRLRLTVDSSLKDQLLAAHIVQYTASQVYLNGQLIREYGIINTDPKKVQAWLPSAQPFLINLLRDRPNLIAVRVAYQPGLPYIAYLGSYLPVFDLYINHQQTAVDNYSAGEHQLRLYVIIFSISSGILLIIGFIYLVYFLYDKTKKVHLYYGLSMLALGLNALPIEIWGADRYGKVGLSMWVFYFEGVASMVGMWFMLLTIYSLFNYPRRSVFKVLIGLSLIMIVGMYTVGTLAFFAVTYLFPSLFLLEGTYACVWAIRHQKKDAYIILAGVLFYLIISILSVFIPLDSVPAQLLSFLAQMSFPIGMSFYLGLQNSLTNTKLRITLEEVQTLSAENLAKEQEKQQLLSSQNELLEHQVTERTAELNHSLQELKSTQSQLIQHEKMASLGQLTAGIAHEIQNPLNFVNNFSDLNKELLEELKAEADKGNMNEVKTIANDVIDNSEKISHHGKRADAIVKGMMLHSGLSTGIKEPTDINALADDYLRMAYRGYRTKDNSFHATIQTDFDDSIGKINVIPQDMERVLLNLYNNAFYAVSERKKMENGQFEPVILVGTKRVNGQIEISVKDNGNGIPEKILDKIFQPFFTTKPTGQGTGLGLSLSYDIVKAHGGELKAESQTGEGAAFVVQIPVV